MTPENPSAPTRLDFVRTAFDRLQSVADVAHVLIDSEPSQVSYAEALGMACEKIGAKTGLLFLSDDSSQELVLAASVGVEGNDFAQWPILAMGEGLSGWVAENRKAYFSNDLSSEGRFQPVSVMKYRRASALSVPILRNGQLLGVLTFADERPGAFGRADLLLAEAVASSLALGLRCAQLRLEAEASYLSVIRGLANALEAKDAGTQGHSLRIAHLCREVGRALSFDKERLDRLEAAAYLHDIGKIGIPESVLNKPGKLTDEEWTTIRRHPQIGAEILKGIPSLTLVAGFVEAHHERLDGTGYPHGLKGEEIPLESRIISAADAFDAMVNCRPYRSGLALDHALAELCRLAGVQFDPTVVSCIMEVVQLKSPAHFFGEGRVS